jgi:HSP20 family protein
MRDVFGEDLFSPMRLADDGRRCWAPAVDIFEEDAILHLHFDVPGVDKDAIKVEFHDGVLSVSGQRKSVHETANWLGRERWVGEFTRSFRIGEVYDPKSIGAKFDNGILMVTIGKREESKPMTIKVS